LAATGLSLLVAHDRGAAARETLKAAQYLLTFGVAALAWSLDPDRRRLRLALVLTVAAVCVLALAQEFGGAPSGIWYHGKAFPRIAGPLEGPNQLAGYLGIVIPFLAVFSLEAPLWPSAAGALAAAALVLTLSRAGLVAGAIALAIVVIARRLAIRPFLAGAGAGILASAGVLVAWHVSDIGSRFVSFSEVERAGGVGTRSILWRAAIALWREHPLLGVGAGNYELDLPAVAPAGVKTHANSWYLQSLVEGGIPLLGATLAEIWASIFPLRNALGNDLCLAAFAASIGFALHGIFDLLVFFPKVAVTWFVMLGVGAIEARRTS
jgi:O-antigen ligase